MHQACSTEGLRHTLTAFVLKCATTVVIITTVIVVVIILMCTKLAALAINIT